MTWPRSYGSAYASYIPGTRTMCQALLWCFKAFTCPVPAVALQVMLSQTGEDSGPTWG